jgi:tetratricopeptide (TPR) repeat protein
MPGALEARKKMVSATMHYLDQLAKDQKGHPRLQLALATGYARVAELKGAPPGQASLGDWAGALAAYRQAAAILDDLLLHDPRNAVVLLRRAEISREMAVVIEIVELLELQPVVQSLADRYPDDPDALIALAQTNSFLGIEAVLMDRPNEDLDYYQRAAEIYERGLALRHDTVAERELLLQYSHLSGALAERGTDGDRAAALKYARKQLAIAESLKAADPDNRIAAIDVAGGYVRIASALPDAQNQEAMELIDKAEEVLRQYTANAPQFARLAIAIATLDTERADRMKRVHRYDEALVYCRRALAATSAIAAKSHETAATVQVVWLEGYLCELLARCRRRNETAAAAAKAVEDAKRLGPAWGASVPKAMVSAGDAFVDLASEGESEGPRRSDWLTAAGYYRDALEVWAKLPDARKGSRKEVEKATAALERCQRELE